MAEPNKVYVTWEQVESYVNKLIETLRKQNCRPTGVFGIPRGGLILATLISYKMDIPLLMHAARGCLVVDDIADSGRTLLHYKENDTQFNRYFIATVYYHKRSQVIPDFYLWEKNEDWIVFPWEGDK